MQVTVLDPKVARAGGSHYAVRSPYTFSVSKLRMHQLFNYRTALQTGHVLFYLTTGRKSGVRGFQVDNSE